MKRWRRKSMVVDAVQFDSPLSPMPDWMDEAFGLGHVYYQGGDRPYLTVNMFGVGQRAEIGDWIVRDDQGKLHVVTDYIFHKRYEPLDESDLTLAAERARSLIDRALGDTDPADPGNHLLQACQLLSAALERR